MLSLAGETTPEAPRFKSNVGACKGMTATAVRAARVLIAVATSGYGGADFDRRVSEKQVLRVEAKRPATPMQDVLVAWIAVVDHERKAMRVDDQMVIAWAERGSAKSALSRGRSLPNPAPIVVNFAEMLIHEHEHVRDVLFEMLIEVSARGRGVSLNVGH